MAWLVLAAKRQTLSQITSPTLPSRRATSRDSPPRKHKRPVRQSTLSRPRSRQKPTHKTRRTEKNRARLVAIGVKKDISAAITSIVGSHITNPILRTTDGSYFRTVDEYDLHQLISAVKGGAKRPSAKYILQMMDDVMATTFDWRVSAATNLEQLLTTIAKAATYGVRFHNYMKGLVITENVAHAVQHPWGSELAEAQRKIKAKYLYNQVHDAESIIDMMIYLAAADEQRNCQEATAPENSKTDNMVNLGIEWLQQLVQQPPSEHASTNRDKESAMAATDSKSSAETQYCTRGQKKNRKGRRQRHRSRTPSTSPSWSPPRYCSILHPRRSSSRKPDKRGINTTSCPHCK